MAAAMKCLCGRNLKLFMQIYATSARYKYLQIVRCMSEHPLGPGNIPRQNKYIDDFLGIKEDEVESLDTSSSDVTSTSSQRSGDRLASDSVSRRANVKQRRSKKKEILKKTHFGFVRFDGNNQLENRSVNKRALECIKIPENDNKIRTKHNDTLLSDLSAAGEAAVAQSGSSSDDINPFDSQYFSTESEKKEQAHFNCEDKYLNTKSSQQAQVSDELLMNQKQFRRQSPSADSMSTSLNFIDDQYFESVDTSNNIVDRSEEVGVRVDATLDKTEPSSDMSYVDHQYFGSPGLPDMSSVFSHTQSSLLDKHTNSLNSPNVNEIVHAAVSDEHVTSHSAGVLESGEHTSLRRKHQDKTGVQVSGAEPAGQRESVGRWTRDERPMDPDPESAYHFAMKLRRELKHAGQAGSKQSVAETSQLDDKRRYEGPVDSKGFRILKNQVPDLEHTPSAMIANELKKNIIYNKGDVIAIYKPYGLPSHGGPGVRVSVGQLLEQLCDLLSGKERISSLHLVHRLDKETTGVMLLAKTPEMAWRLKTAFRNREVTKTYWVIVKGIPKPSEGIIDIPMAEATVGGKHRMVLRPEHTEYTKIVDKKRGSNSLHAVTKYRTLDTAGDAALVECQPETGVKHQIRVHLAYGLNTPVLGDHKYSHFSKLAPQRLFPDMLQRLGIRQSKVRHVPMHLHARSVVVPEVLDGRNLVVSCRLPHHFVTNMTRLRLKPPSRT